MEALEAVKWIVGIGTPLTGRLLVCDGESMEFHIIPIARDPACTVCGAAAHSACTTRGSL
jgi:adenylyltransferase/sulfurtransferase